MDLLSASLRTIFYDANISEILEEIKNNKVIFSNKEFRDIVKWIEKSFSVTELDFLALYVQESAGFSRLKKRHSMLNLLNLFTSKTLRLGSSNGGDPIPQVCFNSLLEWREISLLLGEDILTTAFLASPEHCLRLPLNNYAWSNIIEHDYLRLSHKLNSGLTDIHAHLKASADVFELTWMSFMNRVIGRSDNFEELRRCADPQRLIHTSDKFIDPIYLVRLAAGLRYWIFEILLKENPNLQKILDELRILVAIFHNASLNMKRLWELQACINIASRNSIKNSEGHIIDYAIIKYPGESVYGIHSGERRLLHSFFHRYFRNDRIAHSIADYVFLYLVIKIRIRREFIQTNELVGFDNFKLYENRKAGYCDSYYHLYERYAVQSAIRPQSNDEFEARVTTGNVPDISINRSIFGNHTRYDINPDTLSFVIHLIKSPIRKSSFTRTANRQQYKLDIEKVIKEYNFRRKKIFQSHLYRNQQVFIPENSYLSKTSRQIIDIRNKHLSANSRPVFKITGIDAAGSELDCLPETFGHVFRYARINGITGLTYHVGEDFYDLADGLRVIDEAITFLNLEESGRLGHATALGVDADKYYKKRRFQVITTQQRLLDTIVWLKYNVSGLTFPLCLGLKAEELFQEIGYTGDYDTKSYYLSQRLRSDDIIQTANPLSKWAMTAECKDETSMVARKIKKAEIWCKQYLLNRDIIKNGEKKIKYDYPLEIIELVVKAQDCLRKRIVSKHIFVECNPSSNFKIGHIDNYESHHIFPLFDAGIASGIGTDDKGIFATSLTNEYSIIAKAALNRGMTEDQMIDFISKIKDTARRRKFTI